MGCSPSPGSPSNGHRRPRSEQLISEAVAVKGPVGENARPVQLLLEEVGESQRVVRRRLRCIGHVSLSQSRGDGLGPLRRRSGTLTAHGALSVAPFAG